MAKKKRKTRLGSLISQEIGRRIVEEREKQGLSRNKFAHSIDMETNNLMRIERGDVDVRVSTLVRIAAGLKVGLERLLEKGKKK